MGDVLLIALYAFLGAAAAGLGGALALRLLRHRSLTASVTVVAAVAVLAMLAGTLAVAWAMLLNTHDLTVVTVVVAMAAVASLATALLLGRRVVASSRRLALATRSFGDGGSFDAPVGPTTSELAALSRELAATSAKLTESRERERALETSRRELVAWISHDLRTPLAGLRAMAEALEDGMAKDPDRYFRQIRTEVERLNSMVGDLFELSRIHAGALSFHPARMSVHDLIGDALAGADPLAREHGVRLVGDARRRGTGRGGRQGDDPRTRQPPGQRHPAHPGGRHRRGRRRGPGRRRSRSRSPTAAAAFPTTTCLASSTPAGAAPRRAPRRAARASASRSCAA